MANKIYPPEMLKKLQEYVAKSKERSYEMLTPGPDDVIADIGCGLGHDAIMLAKTGAKVYAIDHDADYLKQAQEHLEKGQAEGRLDKGLNVEYVNCGAESLLLPDNSVNKVRFERVLQHVNDHSKVISEVVRVLKPGGQIQILDTDYLGMTIFLEDDRLERKLVDYIAYERIPNAHKVRSIPKLLEQNNFDISSVEVHNYKISDYELANYLFGFKDVLDGLLEKGSISKTDHQNWPAPATKDFHLSINYLLFLAQKR